MRIRTKNNKNKTQDIHHTHKGIHKHIRHTHFFLVVAIILIIAGFLINLVVYKSFALNKKIAEETYIPVNLWQCLDKRIVKYEWECVNNISTSTNPTSSTPKTKKSPIKNPVIKGRYER